MILWSLCRRRRREADVAAATRPVLVVSACRRPVRLGSWQRLLAPLQCGLRCGSDGRSLSCAGLCELGVAMHTETDCIRECLSTMSWLVAQRRVWRAWVALGHGTVGGVHCAHTARWRGWSGRPQRGPVAWRQVSCTSCPRFARGAVQCDAGPEDVLFPSEKQSSRHLRAPLAVAHRQAAPRENRE